VDEIDGDLDETLGSLIAMREVMRIAPAERELRVRKLM